VRFFVPSQVQGIYWSVMVLLVKAWTIRARAAARSNCLSQQVATCQCQLQVVSVWPTKSLFARLCETAGLQRVS